MYARSFEGKPYEFGVLGVDKGTLILYDKQTDSRWSQLFGQAINGPMKGHKLEKLPSTMATWGQWKQLHPNTTVYVKPTAYSRRFTTENFEHIVKGEDGPIQPNDLVVGFEGHIQAKVYLVRRLAQQRLVHDTFEGVPILVYLSADYSTVRIFTRVVDEHTLHFTLTEDEFLQDEETASRWHPVTAEAIAGPLKSKKLENLVSTYSLWFAWQKYRPDTTIYGEQE
ncbi:DUF3179 domain-containing protein [Candidatus Bathyarchaeota archaeon]|nr:DUF3179 domain-containing protein [Candidatus Bathyarchaeota archaeon]